MEMQKQMSRQAENQWIKGSGSSHVWKRRQSASQRLPAQIILLVQGEDDKDAGSYLQLPSALCSPKWSLSEDGFRD